MNRAKTKKREKKTNRNKLTKKQKNKEGKGHKQANKQTGKLNLADVIGLLILLTFSHGQCI